MRSFFVDEREKKMFPNISNPESNFVDLEVQVFDFSEGILWQYPVKREREKKTSSQLTTYLFVTNTNSAAAAAAVVVTPKKQPPSR